MPGIIDPKETRSEVVIRRTYSRPKDDGTFETWPETVNRVIQHQNWLWARAKGSDLEANELLELEDFRQLMLDKSVTSSGRTLWLGGTNIAKTRESSQFNCSFTNVETVYDVVDVPWLLLQGKVGKHH